jgi:serine/threonine protein kinase
MSSEQGKSSMSAKFSRRRFMSTRMSKHSYMKNEFMKEMRLLSKLRHPCITTVMGAVCENRHEPMLVMEYMDHGSLFDMIQNVTIALDYEIIIPILQDIAQGILFLHRATPQVIHG